MKVLFSFLPLVIRVAQALSNITVASSITGDTSASITYSNGDSSTYKVYLAATVPGYPEGPSCYLLNSTTLPSSGLNITIPASVGPSATNYYSIALAPSNPSSSSSPSSPSGLSYSPQFDFVGGTGTISDYEKHLGGAPLWYASQLPCTAYDCARHCAQEGYPDDLHGDGAYTLMNACIEACPGVTGGPPTSGPPLSGGNASTTTTAAPSGGPTAGPGGVNATSTPSGAGPGGVNATSTLNGGGGTNSTAPTTSLSSFSSSETPCETSATANGNLSTTTYVGPRGGGGGIRGRQVEVGVMAAVVATATTIASEI
ncbi:hypothetical protein EV356DRAFT_172031 [Viridothelium virens]|uniref:Uncharacterized protein n=1 Tax=Viridothelium virens TaxID=1048519 RepID=A0A6A6HNF2_VIRVR|nr:hypothetical protein EV356DRAFT_172031 [Viridothelium virens]